MGGDYFVVVARVDDSSGDRVAGGDGLVMVAVGRMHHRLDEANASMEIIGGEP
jgi:hypothetical protein